MRRRYCAECLVIKSKCDASCPYYSLSTLHSINLLTCLSSTGFAWVQARSKLGELIRPNCITILHHNLPYFIDIFHIMMLPLCYFALFCKLCSLPERNHKSQETAGKIIVFAKVDFVGLLFKMWYYSSSGVM